MADKINVKVTGIPEAINALKNYQIIKKEAIQTILKEVGFKIERDVKTGPNIPVRYGRLRASISTNWSGSGKPYGKVGAQAKSDDGVGQPSGPRGLVVAVGSDVKYAHMMEFGYWGDASKTGEAVSPKKPKKHTPRKLPSEGFLFLTKAYHKNEPKAAKRIAKVMKKEGK